MEYFITLFIVFVIIDILIVFYVFLRKKKKAFTEKERAIFLKRWSVIRHNTDKNAIIDADKLLDHYLQLRGYHGTVADKLKASKSIFSDLDGIWYSHKLRNRLVHEIDFQVKSSDVSKALRCYEKAFKDIGILS